MLIAWAVGFSVLGLELVGQVESGFSRWIVFGSLCVLTLTAILRPKGEEW